MTKTSAFGVSAREGHDASSFYGRAVFQGLPSLAVEGLEAVEQPESMTRVGDQWVDRIFCHSSERMGEIRDGSIGLAFTSPPYNVGKAYDCDLDLVSYLRLLGRVAAEVHRVLVPGGRFVVNVANLGRKPYVPLVAYAYAIHTAVGFIPTGEIIWQKAKGANGSCAWGTFQSARSPRLRDVHEYLLVFAKGQTSRPDEGESDISKEDFMASTLSVWDIPPESAKRIGHPAPFPVALAERVIRLFSYTSDVILDPFVGSGTTCVAARALGRGFVGYDVSPEYCKLAEARIERASVEQVQLFSV